MRKDHQQKFVEFIRMCKEAKSGDPVVVSWPQVLGDNYDEIIENLNLLADAGLALHIAKRHEGSL